LSSDEFSINIDLMSKSRPKIDIDRLREIGWSLWDPIGLDGKTGVWREESFADEYDTYLIKAAGMLRNNVIMEDVVSYLFHIESEHMGLGPEEITPKIQTRLLKVVQAISDDPLVWSDFKT
jgi:hypothetical protein